MKSISFGLVVVSAGTLFAVTACTDRSRQQPGTVGSQDQVVQQTTVPENQGKLGEQGIKKGETEVRGTQTTITRKTEGVSEDIPTVTKGERKADINRMGADDFAILGLPRNVAQKIVDYRDNQGKFSSPEDLRRVPGMDLTWLEQNKDKLGVSKQAAGKAANVKNKNEH